MVSAEEPAAGRRKRRRGGGGRAAAAGLVVSVLLLASCEPEPEPEAERILPPGVDRIVLTPSSFDGLPGWLLDQHTQSIPALRRSCERLLALPPDRALGSPVLNVSVADMLAPCTAIASVPHGDAVAARAYFERWFRPFLVANNDDSEGLFTGYFEIELRGSLVPTEIYSVPIYRPPDDLVTVNLGQFDASLAGRAVVGRVENGRLEPYFPRRDIQEGALDGKGLELVWINDPLDAFMLHVQGSGRVVLEDGRTTRIGYAGHNGYPYKSIGRELIERGALERGQASWQDIRSWMEANPSKAAELLSVNRRYIFFQENGGEGPLGAQNVALTAGRSLAVDPRYIPLGVPLWLDTGWPGEDERPLRRLVVAQDTGAAIKGPVRGDFYWGTGDTALSFAGRMKQRGRYYLLLPLTAAERQTAS